MSYLKVKGFPQSVNLPFILHQLKGLLPIAHVGKFWVRDISDVGPDYCQITLELSSQKYVREAIKCLDQFQFTFKGSIYSLEAHQDYSSSRLQEHQTSRYQERQNWRDQGRQNRRDQGRQNWRDQEHQSWRNQESQSWRDQDHRDRNCDDYGFRSSPSPEFGSDDQNTKSNFDIEMDFLRQQTKIMEQERKLIMERKKLEIFQEFGQYAPSTVESPPRYSRYSYNDDMPGSQNTQSYESNNIPEYETVQAPRRPNHLDRPKHTWHSKWTSFPTRKTQKTESRPKRDEVFRKPSKLPHFIGVSKKIMEDIEKFFPENISEEEQYYLRSIITLTIRKRTSAALEGKPKLEKLEIINLYRNLYPNKLDAKLVEKTLADLKSKCQEDRLTKLNEDHGTTNNANENTNQNMEAENTATNSGNLNLKQIPKQPDNEPEQENSNSNLKNQSEYSVSPGDPSLVLNDSGDWLEGDINEWI